MLPCIAPALCCGICAVPCCAGVHCTSATPCRNLLKACTHPIAQHVHVEWHKQHHARHTPHQQQKQAVDCVQLEMLQISFVQPPPQVDCSRNSNSSGSICLVTPYAFSIGHVDGEHHEAPLLATWLLQSAGDCVIRSEHFATTYMTPPSPAELLSTRLTNWCCQLRQQYQHQVHMHNRHLRRHRQRQQRNNMVNTHLLGSKLWVHHQQQTIHHKVSKGYPDDGKRHGAGAQDQRQASTAVAAACCCVKEVAAVAECVDAQSSDKYCVKGAGEPAERSTAQHSTASINMAPHCQVGLNPSQ